MPQCSHSPVRCVPEDWRFRPRPPDSRDDSCRAERQYPVAWLLPATTQLSALGLPDFGALRAAIQCPRPLLFVWIGSPDAALGSSPTATTIRSTVNSRHQASHPWL